MNCRVLSRISPGTKHPPQYCGLRTDGTRIKINQTSEAWPVWSDQTNQVSRHPSWPGGLLNHTKSVPDILDLRQILYTYFTFQWWKFTTIYFNRDRDIYSISPQSVNLCLRSNQSWQPHTGVPPLEMSSVQAVRFMSTVCPGLRNAAIWAQCSPSDVIKVPPHPSQGRLIIGTLSGRLHCVWPSISMSGLNQHNADAPHQMQMSSRCYGFQILSIYLHLATYGYGYCCFMFFSFTLKYFF